MDESMYPLKIVASLIKMETPLNCPNHIYILITNFRDSDQHSELFECASIE